MHAGAFAVLALVFAIALQTAALTALLREQGAAAIVVALATAHMLSRAAMALVARRLPPARAEGMGHGVARPGAAAVVIALPAALPPLLIIFGPAAALIGPLAALLAATPGMTWLAKKYFGGQTGDVLGATEVVTRTTMLVALAAA